MIRQCHCSNNAIVSNRAMSRTWRCSISLQTGCHPPASFDQTKPKPFHQQRLCSILHLVLGNSQTVRSHGNKAQQLIFVLFLHETIIELLGFVKPSPMDFEISGTTAMGIDGFLNNWVYWVMRLELSDITPFHSLPFTCPSLCCLGLQHAGC